MKKAKTYDTYKPTDIGWLPNIPSHWEIVDTKRCFSFPKEIVGSDFTNYKVLSLSVNGVIFRDMASGAGKHHSDMGTYQIIRPDSIVLCLFDMDVTPRIVGHSDKTGIITSAYVNIAPRENISSKYYYYYFLLQDFNKYLFSQGTGIRTTLTRSQFGALKMALPTPEEQTTIASFLDYKLAKINRFIRKKKQLIKLLNEQKAAIINQAVTKGLDPNAKMKDSGIEWLGEIPEHWEATPLKHLLKPNGLIRGPFGSALRTDFFVKSGYKVYEQKNAIYKDLKLGTSYIDDAKFIELKRFEVCEGDFLMSCSGTIGKLHKVMGDFEKGIINQAMMIMRIKEDKLSSDYFYWLFESDYIRSGILDNSKGSAMKNLVGINEFKSLLILLPTIEEQKEIIEYLTKETAIIDKAISKIEKEISLVEEYKTTLIAEAVTGKIDVRGFEVPEIESEEETYEDLEEEMSMAAEDGTEYENQNEER